MFPECWLGAEGERRVGTCMPYMYTCRIATGEVVVHVAIRSSCAHCCVVCINVPTVGTLLCFTCGSRWHDVLSSPCTHTHTRAHAQLVISTPPICSYTGWMEVHSLHMHVYNKTKLELYALPTSNGVCAKSLNDKSKALTHFCNVHMLVL